MVPQGLSEGVDRPAGIDKVTPLRNASRVVYFRNTIRVEIQDMRCSRDESLSPWPVGVLK